MIGDPLRKILLGAMCALIVCGLYLEFHPRRRNISPQKAVAPDFLLPQLNGETLRLSDYRGKVVLLDFWATWCEPCREETPHMVEWQNKYRDQGLQIIGVSMDDGPEPVQVFYRQFRMNYPVAMGNAEIGKRYGGILGLPVVYVLDRAGRIVTKRIGTTSPDVIEKDIRDALGYR